jgi:hypothetical protein
MSLPVSDIARFAFKVLKRDERWGFAMHLTLRGKLRDTNARNYIKLAMLPPSAY